MFAKTFSFWRQFVGPSALPAAPTQPSAKNDERRLWVRYATDLHGNVQLTHKQDGEKMLAKVRDLSLGGANLHVDRLVEPGQMLTLELPAEDGEVRTVLACVVRVGVEDDSGWSLGCVFSRELSNDDLGKFGARKVQAEKDDQRTWVRFASSLSASYRKVGDPLDTAKPAEVLNISANGIGLSVQPSLKAGALVNVDLLDRTGRIVRTMLACVVHTSERAGGKYAVGCNFIRELSEEELQALL
jgi:c-di-GMP-binding flagellar brake protein YcgR